MAECITSGKKVCSAIGFRERKFFLVPVSWHYSARPWTNCWTLTPNFHCVSSKKNFVIRIDNETYKILEKWAADEFRSVNGQIEWILHQKLKEAGRLNEDNNGKITNKKP